MKIAHDDYKLLDTPEGVTLAPCPVCRSDAGLWQFSESVTDPTKKVVMCSNGAAFGPQNGLMNEGCLLYMPPDDFYMETIRDAVSYWNKYAVALGKIQRANSWERAKVLRHE